MPLTPALERQTSELKASLVHRVSFRRTKTLQRNPVPQNNKKNPAWTARWVLEAMKLRGHSEVAWREMLGPESVAAAAPGTHWVNSTGQNLP